MMKELDKFKFYSFDYLVDENNEYFTLIDFWVADVTVSYLIYKILTNVLQIHPATDSTELSITIANGFRH